MPQQALCWSVLRTNTAVHLTFLPLIPVNLITAAMRRHNPFVVTPLPFCLFKERRSVHTRHGVTPEFNRDRAGTRSVMRRIASNIRIYVHYCHQKLKQSTFTSPSLRGQVEMWSTASTHFYTGGSSERCFITSYRLLHTVQKEELLRMRSGFFSVKPAVTTDWLTPACHWVVEASPLLSLAAFIWFDLPVNSCLTHPDWFRHCVGSPLFPDLCVDPDVKQHKCYSRGSGKQNNIKETT